MRQLITIEMDHPISGDMVGRMVKVGLHYGMIIVVDDDVEAGDVSVENRIKMIENRIKMLEQKASDLFTSIAKIDDIDIDRRLKILTGRLELTTRNAVANENELLKIVEKIDDLSGIEIVNDRLDAIDRKQAEQADANSQIWKEIEAQSNKIIDIGRRLAIIEIAFTSMRKP